MFSRLKDGKTVEDSAITYENHIAKYTIQETTEDMSSVIFTVKAQNNAGTAETSCQLKIQESPRISCDEDLVNQRLTMNDEWKITINLSGFPRPDVIWTKNNKKITDKRISIETKKNISIITIPSLVRDDTATYMATAINEADSTSMEFHLRVIGLSSNSIILLFLLFRFSF